MTESQMFIINGICMLVQISCFCILAANLIKLHSINKMSKEQQDDKKL